MAGQNSRDSLAINTLRFLAADAIQEANSGHPGLPMGTAALAYTLWVNHLSHNPANPDWPNRDRFVLSGGHGSMLLYALLHLTGYALSLEEIRNFRQWGSLTPGHPEYGLTPGVETTTGPLGQGFANGVGFAIAEAHLGATYNRPDFPVIDHYTYGLVTDGDLMEGVTSEAASLAGHLRLGKLIYLYDDNRITIDGSTDITFTEDRAARFEAYHWQVLHVEDGNDIAAVDQAITRAKSDERPSLIICRTHIGYGLPTKQDTAAAHGSPPGVEELMAAKEGMGWPIEPHFYIPEEAKEIFRKAGRAGKEKEERWLELMVDYQEQHPDLAAELKRRLAGELPGSWQVPNFPADEKGMATRAASGKVLNELAGQIPELVGGSADLAPSNKTWLDGELDFQPGQYQGRNFHFGVREHGMGSVVNGMAIHGGLIPYGGTFLVFSDYMRPAVRVSALSHIPSIWVYTHDSIGVGEDGPTHQPVEHLAALRAIPQLTVLRPADANETAQAWSFAITHRDRPTALALSRQALPVIDRDRYHGAEGLLKGAYVLGDLGSDPPELILMATGSEVDLIIKAGEALAAQGVCLRLVSFPSWEVFRQQDPDYQESVLPRKITRRLVVEAGISQGWMEWVGAEGITLTVDKYGASAPADIIYEKYGLTVEKVIDQAEKLMRRK
ncbi:MAG TPA: transketolase [Chloroflexi bacterium]|nr:MAG: transketolase [Chloroflexota bacterium]HDD56142.1 transketolase [Chloroflexota bacterium]